MIRRSIAVIRDTESEIMCLSRTRDRINLGHHVIRAKCSVYDDLKQLEGSGAFVGVTYPIDILGRSCESSFHICYSERVPATLTPTTEVVQHRLLGPLSNPAELSKTAKIAASGKHPITAVASKMALARCALAECILYPRCDE